MVEYMVRRQAATNARLAGKSRPWSSDPVINTYKFCSVLRDDDRTSIEARNYIMDRIDSDQSKLTALLVFRLLNRVNSIRAVMEMPEWSRDSLIQKLYETKPLFSNAYRVMVPGGLYNREGVADLMIELDQHRSEFLRMNDRWLAKAVHKKLRELGLGPFVAYQTMQDLRWLWGPYVDEDEWAYIGPGALRGLDRIKGIYKPMSNTERRDNAVTLGIEIPAHLKPILNDLLTQAKERLGPKINMFEIEHNLCEWDKYCRYASGETSGTKFKPKD